MGNGILPMLLLVEDNPDDQRFFLRAMKKSEFPVIIHLASDGEQAIEVLSRPPERLSLVLSDVHLPRLSGWDVLRWVRGQASVRRLPFLIWTSMPDPDGARKALELGANGYLSKPIGLSGHQGVLSAIGDHLRD